MNRDERELLLNKIEREAHDSEVDHWGCSQTVLDSLQRNFGIEDIEVFKAASALAGGVVGQQEACGALIGGIMAIGLMYGRQKFEEDTIVRESEEYLDAQVRSRKLCAVFRERFGGLRCHEVFKNIRGDDYRAYEKTDTIEALEDQDTCGKVTGMTARMAAEIMLQPREEFQKEMDAMTAEIVESRRIYKDRRTKK